jgi:hypothetical protein
LCLAEIECCRPFFIGLLGERYGWVPEEIPEGLSASAQTTDPHATLADRESGAGLRFSDRRSRASPGTT